VTEKSAPLSTLTAATSPCSVIMSRRLLA
jgi:hypothetical protein